MNASGCPLTFANLLIRFYTQIKKQVASIGLLTPKRRGNPIDEEKGVR